MEGNRGLEVSAYVPRQDSRETGLAVCLFWVTKSKPVWSLCSSVRIFQSRFFFFYISALLSVVW